MHKTFSVARTQAKWLIYSDSSCKQKRVVLETKQSLLSHAVASACAPSLTDPLVTPWDTEKNQGFTISMYISIYIKSFPCPYIQSSAETDYFSKHASPLKKYCQLSQRYFRHFEMADTDVFKVLHWELSF